ncbi:MAG: T9SS type A sorting domain-containing protein [Hymenobacter sp.]|nr:MAG: T9SS type A sorting domain-containing protein [Hymenobacter sp.]
MQNISRPCLQGMLMLLLLITTPAVAQNLALNKMAAASSAKQPASYAVDGNNNTRWESDYTDPQSITVDLGSLQKVDRIRLFWEAAYGKNFKLQVSASNPADEASWTTIVNVTDNAATDNEYTNLIVSSSGASASVQYVRLVGTARGTAYGYSLYELEVYSYSPGPNLANGKPAVASSMEGGFLASQAFDNNDQTRWGSDYNNSAVPADSGYVYVDLQSTVTISRVYLFWEAAFGKDFKLEVSDDAQTWRGFSRVSGNTARTNDLAISPGATGRYVRMHGLQRGSGYGYSLWEFKVYGTTQPLPVVLTSFSAAPQGAGVAVSWTTASERHNAGFEVQRSANGTDFATLATVAGAGTTPSMHAYTYLDAAPLRTTSYYRLKQLDTDGTFAYGPVAAVPAAPATASALRIYPNPTADYVAATWEIPLASAGRWVLTNSLGQVVHAEALSAEAAPSLSIDLQPYPAGSYVLLVEAGGQVVHRGRVQKVK